MVRGVNFGLSDRDGSDRMAEPAVVAAEIAAAVAEPNVALIQRIVARIGPDAALAFLTEALAIEAAGGLLTSDGARRRTPGGVFFNLVRGRIDPRDRWKLWPQDRPRLPGPIMPFKWEDRLAHLPDLLAEPGVAMTAKLTLIGRPGRVIQAGDCVITTLHSSDKLPTLPKGLPVPPAPPTTFVVYVAAKQWRKVEGALADPRDVLIVEGAPMYDERLPGVALMAQSVTTKTLQATKRQRITQ